jgi:hypothetical protein
LCGESAQGIDSNRRSDDLLSFQWILANRSIRIGVAITFGLFMAILAGVGAQGTQPTVGFLDEMQSIQPPYPSLTEQWTRF